MLALDTCGSTTTLALAAPSPAGWQQLREVSLPPRTAASLLTGALAELLPVRGVQELAAVVVVRGPGSFTGMRVGLAAAKALAEGAGIPLVAVSRLAVLAAVSGSRWTALDAGRGQVYLRDAEADPAGGEWMLGLAEVQRRLCGEAPSALAICEEKLELLLPGARRVAAPTAMDALLHALPRLQQGDWEDAASLDALYLWREEQMLTPPAARS